MQKYGLSFISDQNLYECVQAVVHAYRFGMSLEEFNKNIVDPIKLTFDMKVSRKSIEEIIEREIVRQLDKTINNSIGYFHQNLFSYIDPGWIVPKQGYDIINQSKLIFVEMKNKHNTMNSSSSQKTFMRMQNTLIQHPNATCLLVEIISRCSQDREWTISLDGQKVSCRSIRRISIDRFYQLVTGEPNAFRYLCEALPYVIDDIVQDTPQSLQESTVIKDLRKKSPNLLRSLYMLAFKTYEGFDDLNIE
jgi:hypothetical protein